MSAEFNINSAVNHGEKMTQILQKGSNASLTKIAPSLNSFMVTLEWTFPENDTTQIDIDASAFFLNKENKVRGDKDIVFYNCPSKKDGSIELLERTNPSRQCFTVNLNKVPKDIEKISFTLTLYESEKTQTNFGQVKTIKSTISNPSNTVDYISYELEDRCNETALIIVELYRYKGEWKTKAINQGFAGGLFALSQYYGVKIKAVPAPKPPKNAKAKLNYDTTKFVIFDLETTGLDAYRNEIIEIAAIKYSNGRFIELQFLIRPREKIPSFITNLTGITQAMVDKSGITELQAIMQFIEFIEDYPLIAYNASFDRRFIAASSEKHNLTIGNSYQCALQMARKAFPHLINHKLITVCQSLQLAQSQTHRALADCHLTAAVYLKAAEIIDAVTESIPAA